MYKNIVVPLDESEFAEKVLRQAIELALRFGSTVLLLRVTSNEWEYAGLLQDRYQISSDLYDEVDKEAGEYLADVAQRVRDAGVSSVNTQIEHGDVADAIISVAENLPDCVIAIATHGRSGIQRWTLGSVTDKVVRHSICPTLVVR